MFHTKEKNRDRERNFLNKTHFNNGKEAHIQHQRRRQLPSMTFPYICWGHHTENLILWRDLLSISGELKAVVDRA